MSLKLSESITKISSNFILLKYKHQSKVERGIGSPNSVIVENNEEMAVIDPASWTHNLKLFLKYKNKEQIQGNYSVRKIALTHEHWDHILAGSYFQEKLDFEISSSELEKEAVEDEEILFKHMFGDYPILEREMRISTISKKIVKKTITWMWGPYYSMKVSNTLKEGDTFFDEPQIKVIETPSHTSGSLSFYVPTDKILISGDLMDLETGVGLDLNNPYSSVEAGLKSLEKVKKLDIEILIPGHGEIVKGKETIKKLFEKRIQETTSIYNKIIELLETRPTTLRGLVIGVFPDTRWKINLYYLRKYLIFAYLNEINKKRGLNIEQKLNKTQISI
ncbi:MAG: MBL fold metallo-hydrolase [Candidatus Heimdallarchaeaceae archaeon]